MEPLKSRSTSAATAMAQLVVDSRRGTPQATPASRTNQETL